MSASDLKIVDTRVTVETPEGVDFQYRIAGPGRRGGAYAIDFLLRISVVALGAIIGFLLGMSLGIEEGITAAMLLLAWFVATWLYAGLCETLMRGQTPGKRLMNLRVLRTNGTPIGWFEAFGRNLLLAADGWVMFGASPVVAFRLNTVGLISMASTARMQRLGDLLFDTMVVDETRELIRRPAGLTDGLDIIPRSECSGRYHVPERTLAIVERLFEGDRIIPPLRREEIARPLAEALRERLGWTEPPPDPFNPHPMAEQLPHRNAIFLRRVLKTFAEDPDAQDQSGTATSRTESPQGVLGTSVSGTAVSDVTADNSVEEPEASA